MIVAQRLRKGSCGHRAARPRLVADALKTTRQAHRRHRPGRPLVRADSAFYGHAMVAPRSGLVPMSRSPSGWTRRSRPRSPRSATMPGRRSSTPTPSSTNRPDRGSRGPRSPRSRSPRSPQEEGRAGHRAARGPPDPGPQPARQAGQETLFDTWRFHAFFTTTDPDVADTVAADKTHRGHAIIEQVHADLKNSALAHLPSGMFTANAAWLVLAVMAFNLTRAAATVTGPELAKATTATIRRKLITVPARVASSARRVTLHLPQPGPGRPPGPTCSPGSADHHQHRRPDHPPTPARRPHPERPGSEARQTATPTHPTPPRSANPTGSAPLDRWIEA